MRGRRTPSDCALTEEGSAAPAAKAAEVPRNERREITGEGMVPDVTDIPNLLFPLHLKAPEFHRVSVPREPDETFAVIEPLGRMGNLTAVKGIDIHV